MTVREQFQFFQRLKGLSQSEADAELVDLADHCMLTQVNSYTVHRLGDSNFLKFRNWTFEQAIYQVE